MNKELAKISYLLAQGFSYPGQNNCNKTFFEAVKEVANAFEVPCGSISFSKDELCQAYTQLFINEPQGRWAPPFSSVYLSAQGLLMDKGREQAVKFYKEAGLEPGRLTEPEDFLVTELHFVAELLDSDNLGLLSRFLQQHMLKWFPCFYRRLKALKPHPYYLLLADLTSRFLDTTYQEVIDETT